MARDNADLATGKGAAAEAAHGIARSAGAAPIGLARATRRNTRQCIVTRERDPAEGLIRFVRGPDGGVVPDLEEKLPGRGAWVTARHALVERAAKRHMFSRAFKSETKSDGDLASNVASLMRERLVRMLPLLRKSGDLIAGAGKVDGSVRSGEAALVLHAREAAEDGVRKIAQAIHAAERDGAEPIVVEGMFSAAELGLAFGGEHVIHAAIRRSGGGIAFMERLQRFHGYGGAEREGHGVFARAGNAGSNDKTIGPTGRDTIEDEWRG